MAMAASLWLAAVASPGSSPRPADAGGVAAILGRSAFRSAVARLGGLPILHSGFDGDGAAALARKPVDVQPTHGLLSDDGCLLRAVTDSVVEHMSDALGLEHPLSGMRGPTQEPQDLLTVVSHL